MTANKKNPVTLHIGNRKKAFYSHGDAYRAALSEQSKGLHSTFVIVDEAGRRTEYSRGGKKRNPCKRKKRNPEAAAVEMREAFTGMASDKTIVVDEKLHVHSHLAALGELVQLKVKTLKGVIYTIAFGKEENPRKKKPIGKHIAGWVDRRAKAISGIGQSMAKTWLNPKRINPKGAPILAVTEDGKNLMIVGGSQVIDLKALGMGEFEEKESVIVGDIKTIDYFATKDWKDGKKPETSIYTHRMGEETGDLPLLRYDTRSKKLFIDGGLYRIKRPMFGQTSPGIEN
jgi:hypothetical protein